MHGAAECNSRFTCRSCGSVVHHTILQPDYKDSSQLQVQSEKSNGNNCNQVVSAVMKSEVSLVALPEKLSWIMLGTATIRITGSQISAISEKLTQAVNLPRRHSSLQISAVVLPNITSGLSSQLSPTILA